MAEKRKKNGCTQNSKQIKHIPFIVDPMVNNLANYELLIHASNIVMHLLNAYPYGTQIAYSKFEK